MSSDAVPARPFDPSPRSVEALLAFLDFTEEDAARIRACAPVLTPHLSEIAEDLYAHIRTIPVLDEILSGHLTQCKLKQSTYLQQLLEAQVDVLYAASRAWVGEVHRQMGVPPRWYVAACAHLEGLLVAGLRERSGWEQQQLLETSISLHKLLCFDMIVCNDAFMATLLQARERRELDLERHAMPVLVDIGEGISVAPLCSTVAGDRLEALRGVLLQAYARGARALVVDMTRLPDLDSDGAAPLFDLLRDLGKASDLRVVVAGLAPPLKRDLLRRGISAEGLDLVHSVPDAVAAARAGMASEGV